MRVAGYHIKAGCLGRYSEITRIDATDCYE